MQGNTELVDEFYTVDEFADLMKVKKLTIKRWMKAGKIPYLKLAGTTVRFSRKDIEFIFRVEGDALTEDDLAKQIEEAFAKDLRSIQFPRSPLRDLWQVKNQRELRQRALAFALERGWEAEVSVAGVVFGQKG